MSAADMAEDTMVPVATTILQDTPSMMLEPVARHVRFLDMPFEVQVMIFDYAITLVKSQPVIELSWWKSLFYDGRYDRVRPLTQKDKTGLHELTESGSGLCRHRHTNRILLLRSTRQASTHISVKARFYSERRLSLAWSSYEVH
jgi:hypothetical protein